MFKLYYSDILFICKDAAFEKLKKTTLHTVCSFSPIIIETTPGGGGGDDRYVIIVKHIYLLNKHAVASSSSST